MDPIRKLVSERLPKAPAGPHPDADLLAAFAENAMPKAERKQVLTHLSACADCREVLYLAFPSLAEAQKVFVVTPRRLPRLVLRWGTLAAALVIAAVVFVGTRRQGLFQKEARTGSQPPAAAAPAVSVELKAPAEMDEMRSRGYAGAAGTVARETRADKPAPEKHMTAKLQAPLDFGKSDQVRVATSPGAELSANMRGENRPVEGRNESELYSVRGAKPAVPAQPTTGSEKDDKAFKLARTEGGHGLATGVLGGTISDSSGAVVPNAKVTAVGPLGARTESTDPTGKFAFDNLVPGSYAVKAEASGFKSTELKQVAVLDNKAANVQVKLEPASTTEAVAVAVSNQAAGPKTTAAAETVTVTAAPPAVVAQNAVQLGEEQTVEMTRKKSRPARMPAKEKAAKTPVVLFPQWTLSAAGAVQRSLDLGKTWQIVRVGDGVFRTLASLGSHVWVGGDGGVLYHSADSGRTWMRLTPSVAERKLSADITHIEFADPLHGSINTSAGEVWTTTDGGQTWQVK